MTTSTIQVIEYRCDVPRCESVHEQRGGTGQYWEGVPPGWIKLTILVGIGEEPTKRPIRNLLMCSNCNHGVMSLDHELRQKGL